MEIYDQLYIIINCFFTGNSGDEEENNEDGDSDEGKAENDVIQHEGIGDDPIFEDPLYPIARSTKAVSFLSVLSLAKGHRLTGSCVADMLDLLNLHCPEPTLSIHSYHKYLIISNRLSNAFCTAVHVSDNVMKIDVKFVELLQ